MSVPQLGLFLGCLQGLWLLLKILQELGVVHFSTWRRVGISGWVDFEAREGVTWGTGSTQVEKSEEDVRDVGSCQEELALKAPGSLGF